MTIYFVYSDQSSEIVDYFDDINKAIEYCDDSANEGVICHICELSIYDKFDLRNFIQNIRTFAKSWRLL